MSLDGWFRYENALGCASELSSGDLQQVRDRVLSFFYIIKKLIFIPDKNIYMFVGARKLSCWSRARCRTASCRPEAPLREAFRSKKCRSDRRAYRERSASYRSRIRPSHRNVCWNAPRFVRPVLFPSPWNERLIFPPWLISSDDLGISAAVWARLGDRRGASCRSLLVACRARPTVGFERFSTESRRTVRCWRDQLVSHWALSWDSIRGKLSSRLRGYTADTFGLDRTWGDQWGARARSSSSSRDAASPQCKINRLQSCAPGMRIEDHPTCR